MLVGAAILGLSGYWLLARSPYPTPEAALGAFYNDEPRPECMQAAPLQHEGSKVVSLVIRDLSNKEMPNRRYAIGFLGEGHYAEALPVLEHILSDTTEIDYFRADALLAIFEIAPSRAQDLISAIAPSQVQGRYQILPMMIQAIQAGKADKFISRGCT
jgi:hypothetical protein